MSSNDQYIIREVFHDVFDILDVDVDAYAEQRNYRGQVVRRGLRGLRTAVRATEEEPITEYGYVIEFLEEEKDE